MDVGQAWKNTCKVILGQEIGELAQYEGYLLKYIEPMHMQKSAISGNGLMVSSQEFCKGARFISNHEREQYCRWLKGKIEINVNAIKDINSILEALGGKLFYAGNIVLGNSRENSSVNHCTNVTCALHTHDLYDSKYAAYCNMGRYDEFAFGCTMMGESKFNIRAFGAYHVTRCMEVLRTFNSSDCIFGANLEGCTNCMFSFNQRNKANMIGNLQLSREEYAKRKEKLLEDIRSVLGSRKTMPTIIDILKFGGNAKEQACWKPSVLPQAVQKAYAGVATALFGSEIGKASDQREWLQRHVPEFGMVQSAASAKMVPVSAKSFYQHVKHKFLTLEESHEFAKKHIPKDEIDDLGVLNAPKALEKISYIWPDIALGNNIGNVDCTQVSDTSGCYYGSLNWNCKLCGYSFWPRQSEYVFGSSIMMSSRFCLKCYSSENLMRCFEVSDSNSCADCYFCHNCENLSDCMFCFNAKSMRYAIGNVEVGREGYLRVKKIVLGEIARKIREENKLGLDVYNVGCR